MSDENNGNVQDDTSEFKRVRYSEAAFKYIEEDWQVDQEYHIRMRYRHNKLLYKPGVLDGLEVVNNGDLGINVKPGVALDDEGRELILLQEETKAAPVSPNSLGDENKVFSVVLAYKVESSKADGHPTAGDRLIRWVEKPELVFIPCVDNMPCNQLPNGNKGVVLCNVKVKRVTENGEEKNILEKPDFSVQKYAASRLPIINSKYNLIDSVINDEIDNILPAGFNKWEDKKTCALRVSQSTNNPYSESNQTGLLRAGVRGESNSWDGVQGISESFYGSGVAGWNKAKGTGLWGYSEEGYGIYGESKTDVGIKGVAHGHGQNGVVGIHHTDTPWDDQTQTGIFGNGVYGESNSNDGVAGVSTSVGHAGVSARNDSEKGMGLSASSANGMGIWAVGGKFAARFWGEVTIGHSGNQDTPNVRITNDGKVGIGFGRTPTEALDVDGNIKATGNIRPNGADCAEDFDICEFVEADPGSVMVVGEAGILHPCQQAYDKRVAGVISGGGSHKTAIILDSQEHSERTRKPIALIGKVYCKVDTQYGAIEVGDLLTTSPTPGHAMKACDQQQAFGSVIGKALEPCTEGTGLIPILIALQ